MLLEKLSSWTERIAWLSVSATVILWVYLALPMIRFSFEDFLSEAIWHAAAEGAILIFAGYLTADFVYTTIRRQSLLLCYLRMTIVSIIFGASALVLSGLYLHGAYELVGFIAFATGLVPLMWLLLTMSLYRDLGGKWSLSRRDTLRLLLVEPLEPFLIISWGFMAILTAGYCLRISNVLATTLPEVIFGFLRFGLSILFLFHSLRGLIRQDLRGLFPTVLYIGTSFAVIVPVFWWVFVEPSVGVITVAFDGLALFSVGWIWLILAITPPRPLKSARG